MRKNFRTPVRSEGFLTKHTNIQPYKHTHTYNRTNTQTYNRTNTQTGWWQMVYIPLSSGALNMGMPISEQFQSSFRSCQRHSVRMLCSIASRSKIAVGLSQQTSCCEGVSPGMMRHTRQEKLSAVEASVVSMESSAAVMICRAMNHTALLE